MIVDVLLGRPITSTTGASASATPWKSTATKVGKNPASTHSTSYHGSEQNASVYERRSATRANGNARRHDTYNGREAETVE